MDRQIQEQRNVDVALPVRPPLGVAPEEIRRDEARRLRPLEQRSQGVGRGPMRDSVGHARSPSTADYHLPPEVTNDVVARSPF